MFLEVNPAISDGVRLRPISSENLFLQILCPKLLMSINLLPNSFENLQVSLVLYGVRMQRLGVSDQSYSPNTSLD